MYQIITVKLAEDVKRMKFLKEATSQDEARPILNYIYLDEAQNCAVSANGFKLHLCQIPACLDEFKGHLIKFVQPLKKGLVVIEVIENGANEVFDQKFPVYADVLKRYENQDTLYEIAVDRRFLENTLKANPNQTILLSFGDEKSPYGVESEGDFSDCRAIIMPMHISRERTLPDAQKWHTLYQETLDKLEAHQKHEVGRRLKDLKNNAVAAPVSEEIQTRAGALYEQFSDLVHRLIELENKAGVK